VDNCIYGHHVSTYVPLSYHVWIQPC
jgi:hypothetical protein